MRSILGRLLLLSVTVLMLGACGGNKTQQVNTFVYDSVVTDTCVKFMEDSLSPCADVQLSICYAKGDNAKAMNDSILKSGILSADYMKDVPADADFAQTVEAFKKSYADQYMKNTKELFDEFGKTNSMNASYNVSSKFEINRADTATFVANVYTYDGGAHGQTQTITLNFDTKSGKLLKLTDVIAPGSEKALCDLIVSKLAAQNNVKDLAALKDLSIFAFGEPFVPKSFILEADGITFIYQADEIAAHSVGEIRVAVSQAELASLSKK